MPRLSFFNLFYSTSFTLLTLVLLALLLVPPSDAIAQALKHPDKEKQLYSIFTIAGAYVLTSILAVTFYTGRMYTVRQRLSDIPKTHPPISKSALPKRIYAAVAAGISRSAAIALAARPRGESQHWRDEVVHNGWAPPGGRLRGVEYSAVVGELPRLLEREAQAVVEAGGGDARAVVRRASTTMRAWVEGLVEMGVAPREECEIFLSAYERARFRRKGDGIAESEFCGLMKALGGMLEGMKRGGGGDGDEEGEVEAWETWGGYGTSVVSSGYDPIERVESEAVPVRGGRAESSGAESVVWGDRESYEMGLLRRRMFA